MIEYGFFFVYFNDSKIVEGLEGNIFLLKFYDSLIVNRIKIDSETTVYYSNEQMQTNYPTCSARINDEHCLTWSYIEKRMQKQMKR